MFYEKMRKARTDLLKLALAIATLIASSAIPFAVSALVHAEPQTLKPSPPRTGRPRLIELHGIDRLQEAFERDAGKVRIVALLSPT